MNETLTTFLALSLCLAAGCGGGDDESSGDSAKAPAKAENAAKAAPASGDVPTYAQVKALALKDTRVAKLCADGGEDRRIGISEKGETYTYDLWKLDTEAYVAPGLSGPKSLAAGVKGECGCGETVKGGYGS